MWEVVAEAPFDGFVTPFELANVLLFLQLPPPALSGSWEL